MVISQSMFFFIAGIKKPLKWASVDSKAFKFGWRLIA